MKIQSILCNHCGAPLDVKPRVKFLSCAYCGTHLRVQRNGNSFHTEILEEIQDQTRELREDVDELMLKQKLRELDNGWQQQRRSYLVKNKNGTYSVPQKEFAIGGGVFMAGFGILWTIFASNMGAPFPFPLFGLLFSGFAIFIALTQNKKAKAYKEMHKKYEEERKMLLRNFRKSFSGENSEDR